MANSPTYYQLLEVVETASIEVIKQARKALAQKWHPDKNLDNQVEAAAMMARVNKAYDVLSDPKSRKSYDEELKGSKSTHSTNESSRGSTHHRSEQESTSSADTFLQQEIREQVVLIGAQLDRLGASRNSPHGKLNQVEALLPSKLIGRLRFIFTVYGSIERGEYVSFEDQLDVEEACIDCFVQLEAILDPSSTCVEPLQSTTENIDTETAIGCLFWIVLIVFGLSWYVTIDSRLDTKIAENAHQLEQVLEEMNGVRIRLEQARKEQGWIRTKINDTEKVDKLENRHDYLGRQLRGLQEEQQELTTEKKRRIEDGD